MQTVSAKSRSTFLPLPSHVTLNPRVLEKYFDGWQVGQVISHGAQGQLYELKPPSEGTSGLSPMSSPDGLGVNPNPSKTKSPPRLVKCSWRLGDHAKPQPDGEGHVAWLAGKLGIGPEVYAYGLHAQDGVVYEYIVFQRLSGPTLDGEYPYNPEHIKQALNLYYTLLRQTSIIHGDIKADNLMLDTQSFLRLYLIDYGIARILKIAQTWTQQQYAECMGAVAERLIKTLTTRSRQYNTVDHWLQDTVANRTRVFMSLITAAEEWLQATFPGCTVRVIPPHDVKDLDLTVPEYRKWYRRGL